MGAGDRLRDGGEAAVDLAVKLEATLHHRGMHGLSVPDARKRRADGEVSRRRDRPRTPLDATPAVALGRHLDLLDQLFESVPRDLREAAKPLFFQFPGDALPEKGVVPRARFLREDLSVTGEEFGDTELPQDLDLLRHCHGLSLSGSQFGWSAARDKNGSRLRRPTAPMSRDQYPEIKGFRRAFAGGAESVRCESDDRGAAHDWREDCRIRSSESQADGAFRACIASSQERACPPRAVRRALEGHVARRKAKAVRYHDLDEDPSCEHVVDQAVRVRVGRPDLDRTMVRTTTAIVKALGSKRRLWFRFEAAADELRALRDAAYFDAGVSHGISAAAAQQLRSRQPAIERSAEDSLRRAFIVGVSREDGTAPVVMAAGRCPREGTLA